MTEDKNRRKNGKWFEKRQKSDKKPTKGGGKKPEAKNDFRCRECGGNLVRRWIFPYATDGSSCTMLVCDSCGITTKPREIRYGENGMVWGTKIPKSEENKKRTA